MPRHKYYDAIMAWAEGGYVQYRIEGTSNWYGWESHASDTPNFNETSLEWRRKPKRFEEWRGVILDQNGYEKLHASAFPSKEAADSFCRSRHYVRTIRMVEAEE